MPSHEQELPEQQELLPLDADTDDADVDDDDYEVITSEEVDRVLDVLDQLINDVESENVRACLEEAADAIFSLIYDGEEGDEETDAAQDAA
jgi:hypothetical protein